MKALTVPLVSEKAVVLANEFAEVNVELKLTPRGSLVTITDKGTGIQASLDPAAALSQGSGYQTNLPDRPIALTFEVDLMANGPRLKIAHVESGITVFLDPLQLSDAALAGEWGKLPAVFNDSSA
jgi:hypothetical protein